MITKAEMAKLTVEQQEILARFELSKTQQHQKTLDASSWSHRNLAVTLLCHFARVHQTLRVTPAMEAGISNHIWTIRRLLNLLG